MDGEVAEFAKEEQSKEEVDLKSTRTGVERMIDVICTVSCKTPVVAAILEQVEQRHRGI